MRIFLSYSRTDQTIVERIRAALNAAGFESFLDTKDLPLGQEYNARIKLAIEAADLFLFLASEASVRPGSYAMTELSFAEQKWPNPSGYVLPVLMADLNAAQLPAYLRPINALQAHENVDARIVGWVQDRARLGSSGVPDPESPRARLKRWARLAQPPIRKKQRSFLWPGCLGVIFGIGIVLLIGFLIMTANNLVDDDIFALVAGIVALFVALVGVLLILSSLLKTFRGLRGSNAPVAAVILGRETSSSGQLRIKLETLEGK